MKDIEAYKAKYKIKYICIYTGANGAALWSYLEPYLWICVLSLKQPPPPVLTVMFKKCVHEGSVNMLYLM